MVERLRSRCDKKLRIDTIMQFHSRDDLNRFGLEREAVGCEVTHRDYMAMIRKAFDELDSIHPPSLEVSTWSSLVKIHPVRVRYQMHQNYLSIFESV